MNIRHIVSNMEAQTGRELYFGFYVKRGETSENRIKEVKNMYYSDTLSNHSFCANFFRLFISSLAYEIFLKIRSKIQKNAGKAS